MSKYIPKQGEMIFLPELEKQREFIAMTSNGKYLCWGNDKTYTRIWNSAEPIPEKPVYYYQYERINNLGKIILSNFMTDETAKATILDCNVNTWYRIEASKRTWEH